MKKQIFTSILLLATLCSLKAQILNPGFENLNSNTSVKHWGAAILMAVMLDSAGNQMDSLKMDQGFCFSTNDAHTGLRAVEMRNAEWINAGEVIPGRAGLSSNDSDFFAYNNPPVPIASKPVDFTFYYKFFPVNNDTAYAFMSLTDSSGNVVGYTALEIAGTHSVYTLASTPVVYSSSIAPAFVEIEFFTAKPTSTASYGTRFLVDDVGVTTATVNTTGLIAQSLETRSSCFPNPANKDVNLLLKKTNGSDVHIQLITSEGKSIETLSYVKEGNSLKIATDTLAEGLYFLTVTHAGYTYTAKFTKTER